VQRLAREALALAQRLGADAAASTALALLGSAAHQEGDYPQARALGQASLRASAAATLGEASFAAARSAGQALPLDQALREVLETAGFADGPPGAPIKTTEDRGRDPQRSRSAA
jgi:hypothetical protein